MRRLHLTICSGVKENGEKSGARSIETVISFEVNPNTFTSDETVADSIRGIALVSTRPGPITVQNVQEIGFKKEWWELWRIK